MQYLKNMLAGLVVSLFGSLPMGYLNIVALDIFRNSGIIQLFLYLLGIITVEFVLVLLTLIGAEWLLKNNRLVKITEILSIIFLLVLAYSFYTNDTSAQAHDGNGSTRFWGNYPAFVCGLVLNMLNFVQFPFWTGWNLFLLNAGYIETDGSKKYVYVLGTSIGTFIGMSLFVLGFQYLFIVFPQYTSLFINIFFPLVFIFLALLKTYNILKTKSPTQLPH